MRRPRSDTPFPVEPFQEAFKRSDMNSMALARELGWYRKYRRKGHKERIIPDATRTLRTLGLAPERGRNGWHKRRHLRYETAIKLSKALGIDPIDVGL